MATCNSMCPATEIEFRTKNRLISQLEATASTSQGPRSKYVADPEKMVKEYTRSAADTHKHNKPELLRPFSVLNRTVDYLLYLYARFHDRRQAVTSSDFGAVFSFVSDRFRAVRQDMIMQNMNGPDSVDLIQKMLPFYIETDGMCKMEKCATFDPKLHDFQIEECFGRWYEQISEFRIQPDSQIATCFFLRQLHRKRTLLHDLHVFRSMLPAHRFELIADLIYAFNSGNFHRFFSIFGGLDPLLKYCLTESVVSMRKSAMCTIWTVFKIKLPRKVLADWLGFTNNLTAFDEFIRLYSMTPEEFLEIRNIRLVEISQFELSVRQF